MMAENMNCKRFLLVYASETGQAKAIAEEIAERAGGHGLQADVHCVSMTEKKFWLEREKVAVLLSSTTGDGEPPNTAHKFVRRLKKKTLPKNHLQHLHYAFLGLGDSNYTNFCNCGKMIDRRLEELSAKRFYPAGWADDAVGLEVVVEPWIDGLFPALQKHLGVDITARNADSALSNSSDGTSQNTKHQSSEETYDKIKKENEVNVELDNREVVDVFVDGGMDRITEDEVQNLCDSDKANGKEMIGGFGGHGDEKSDSCKDPPTEAVCDIQPPNGNTQRCGDTSREITNRNGSKSDVFGDSSVASSSSPASVSQQSNVKANTTLTQCTTGISTTSECPTASQTGSQLPVTSQAETGSQSVSSSTSGSQTARNSETGSRTTNTSHSVEVTDTTGSQSGSASPAECTGTLQAVASLTTSVPPVSLSNLSLPLCPPPYIQVTFSEGHAFASQTLPLQNGALFPSAASPVTQVRVLSAIQMTREDAVKTALKLELDISSCEWSYCPGDTISVLCHNAQEEVTWLLHRLDMEPQADCTMSLGIQVGTKKKNARVPEYYPTQSTLRHTLTTCCDLRAVPKKACLRALVEHTSDPAQKRRLQELCSKQGTADYTQFIRGAGLGLIDILENFPSCRPTVECILEQCPRLLPRPYSAASSPLYKPGRLDIVFNIIELPAGQGRVCHRQGLCTGMLSDNTRNILSHAVMGDNTRSVQDSECEEGSVEKEMEKLSLEEKPKISIFLRSNQHFRPPEDLSVPLILIGPGTGVAPFIGFLQHRASILKQQDSTTNQPVGECWLFYGCRHKDRDYLFRNELQEFANSGILSHLKLSFSRDEPAGPSCPKYVQDNLKLFGQDVCQLICEAGARVYVCGDAAGMAKNVNEALVEILKEYRALSQQSAVEYLTTMRINRRYLEDVWT